MLYVHGIGHFHPENVLDNQFFESLGIGTDDAWITSRVGIQRRRTVLPLDYIRHTRNRDLRAAEEAALYSNAQTGAHAARMAIARAGLTASDIGLVVAGGCSPQHCIPAEASTIARELGIESPAFDLHSACSSFGSQIHFLSLMGAALPDYALCVQVENNTRVVDYGDRATCVLWGDASAAQVISTKHAGRLALRHSSFGGSPEGALDVTVPHTGHFAQNGAKVQKFAIKRMAALYEECCAAVPPGAPELPRPCFIGHQANLTMLESVARRAEVPPERHLYNIVDFGNQGAAGAPAVLSQHWERVRPGDRFAVAVVGSGLSWAGLLLEVLARCL